MNPRRTFARRNYTRKYIAPIFLMLAMLLVFPTATTMALAIQPTLWAPNGPVSAIATANNTMYLGGLFNQVGPVTGGLVAIDAANGNANSGFPRVDGHIYALAPDGGGGWYIGGMFSSVDNVDRQNLAHVKADKSLDMNWNPGADAIVTAISVSGSNVYVGGGFSHVGGQSRHYLARLDATSGTVTAWNPDADGAIWTLLASGNTVYVSGQFSTIAGQSRLNLGAINAATGTVTTWNPGITGIVNQFAVNGNLIYAAGFFSAIGGQNRKNAAALDITSGNATSWNPDANGGVYTLLVSGTHMYAGGTFTTIGGQPRQHLAALDLATGMATNWNPSVSGSTVSYRDPVVMTLASQSNTLYVGGYFTTIAGQSRNNLAAVDTTTGATTAWDPKAGDLVNALAVSGGLVYAGGNFTIFGGVRRANLAAIDAATGMATAWNPGVSGSSDTELISVLKIQDTTIYAGGAFTSIGGQSRTSLAALSTTTGEATPWNPAPNGTVTTMEISGTTVYVGGWFTTIGGRNRNYLAAVDTTTGLASNWNPDPINYVTALALNENTVYVGGSFWGAFGPSIGGQRRDYLAAVDASTGSATAWRPNNPSRFPTLTGIGALLVRGSTIYIGSQQGIYAFDATAGDPLPSWNAPALGGSVISLAASPTTLFVGGGNISSSDAERRYLVALNATTGAISTPLPEPNFTVDAFALLGTTLYRGGGFFTLDGKLPAYFVGLDLDASAPAVMVGEASNIWPTSAMLNGTANANGSTTTVTFHVTTTSGNYTNARSVAAMPNIVSGFAATTVTATITELIPATTYYYRVVATNSGGTTESGERSFTTMCCTVFLARIVR